MLETMRRRLRELAEQRKAAAEARDAVLAAPTAEKRNLTDDETARFDERRAEVSRIDGEIEATQQRIADLEADEARAARAAGILAETGRPAGGATITSEPQIYGRGSGHSYFLDLARSQFRADVGAAERLQRHAAELRVELPAREARREAAARAQMDSLSTAERWRAEQRASVFERRVNPDRTDGQGGYFVPPLWLVDQYIELPRFGRPIANSVRNLTLPGGTDSVNLPKVNTGTATGVQTADAAAVTSTDMTDTFVTAPVRTIAGQQDVAMQLLDQSPVSFDEVVMSDLSADLAVRVDTQVIDGSGAAGQVLGILNVVGPNAITYTDASPTLPEMWIPWMQSVSQIATNRKMPPTATFCIPAIWYWGCSQLDSTNRPLIIPDAGGAFNPMALQNGAVSEGPVGRLTTGTPVILDGSIPTNKGAGTNETRLITLRTSDLYLWEGNVRTRVLQEVLSGTLQVRFQLYEYLAFMPHRLPKAISIVSGTGCIPTTGF